MITRFIPPCSIILFIQLILGNSLYSQDININYKEYPELAKKFNFNVPEGKALFVFEGKENYSFVSEVEVLDPPQKVGSIYKFLISTDSPSGGITIMNDDAANAKINYGRQVLYGDKSYPAINSKDVRYFKLSLTLGYQNVTQKKKSEGHLDQASRGDKDNLIILFPKPKNLDLQILGETTSITKADDGSYRVYTKPDAKKLDLITKGFDKTTIELGDSIGTKNTLYFDVIGSSFDEESVDPNINLDDYQLKTDPPGALIELKGNPPFNEQKHITPFTFLRYEAGTKMVHLSLDRYESTDVIIVIGGKRNNKNVILEPKFGFLIVTVDPSVGQSKILLDGNELIGIENGKKFEILKGPHSVEITAPHYYSQTKQISLAADKPIELNVRLSPKMGSVTIEPGENADGSEIYINEKYIDKLPLRNYIVQEGEYSISYKKNGLVTEKDSYNLTVNVNENRPLKSPPMINLRKIKFSTDPQSGATVFIDAVEKGTTPLTLKLPVGTYKVLIKKNNYKDYSETINLFNDRTEYNYSLAPNYNLSLTSAPSGATVVVDGQIMGKTPVDIQTTPGTHEVIYIEANSIRRIKHYTTDNQARKQSTVLRNEYIGGLGYISANVGEEFGGEFLIGKGHLVFLGSLSKLNSLIAMPTFEAPPNAVGYGLQLGLRIPYPLDFIIHGGVGLRTFKEKGSASSSSSTSNNELDYYSGIAGITLPIHITHSFGIYIKAEYWTTTENNSGILRYAGGIFF